MSLDKISEDRLFLNNTKEEIIRWSNGLKYFHYMRSRGGHNCEGDSFCAYFMYDDKDDLTRKMTLLGVNLKELEEGSIAFDPSQSYSFEELDKLKITIPRFNDLEQPQYVDIAGHKAHIWILADSFEISVSGTGGGQMYKVTENDFEVCRTFEELFDSFGWQSILDLNIRKQAHCISKEKYPELFR